MRPKSTAELTAEIEALQTRIHSLETEIAAQGDTTATLHLREQEFRALVERCPDVIARFDPALRHTYVSPAVQAVTGHPPQAFIGKTSREMGLPQDLAERWETALRRVFETGQELCVECEYSSSNGPLHYKSRLFPERAEDGTIAAVVSIARDVTDRKRVEETLRESVARFRSLWEHSMDGVLLTVPDGRILMANPAACRILGRSEEEICRIGRAGVLDPTDPRTSLLLEERARAGECRGELRFIRPDGTTCTCELTSAVVSVRDGFSLTSMCIRDVTEQKRAEEALRDRSRFNQEILDALPAHICVLDEAGKIIAVNRAWRDFAAANPPMSAAVEIGADYFAVCDAVTGDDAGMAHEAVRGLRAVGRGELPEFSFEYPCHSPDAQRWFLLRSMRLSDGDRPRIVVLHINITERKRAEISLRESEERYRMVVEDQTEIICRFQVDGTITYVNAVYCRFFGKSYQELVGRKWQPSVVPDDQPLIEAKLQTLSPENPVVVIENRVYSGTGEIRWMQFVNRGFFDRDGRLLEIQSIGRDITERRQAEEKLRESEAAARDRAHELATVLAATPALLFISHDPDCRYMTSNPTALRLLRLPADANTSKSAPPGERPETFRVMKDGRELRPEELPVQLAAATGQPVKNFEFTFAFDDDTARDIIGDAVPLLDEEDKVRGAVGAFLDITERKQAEEALRRTEENFRRSLDDSPVGVRIVTAEGETVYANRAILNYYGYGSIEELRTTPVKKRYTPESYARFQVRKKKRQLGENVPSEYEICIIRKDGEVRHLQVLRKEVFWDGERQFQTIYQDITERKRAEDELSKSEERYRTLFGAIDEGFCITEVIFDENEKPIDYRFLEINPSFEKQTGLIGAQGKSMRELAPKHEEYWFEIYGRIAVTGQPARFVNRAEQLHRWYDVYAFRVGQPENRQVGILFNDITERRRVEEALREQSRLSRIFLDALPCVALLLNRDRVVVAANQAGIEAGASPGSRCYSTWGQREDPCPWCLAPTALQAGEPQHAEVESLGVVWDAHWIPVGSDLYLHFAFDITERKRTDAALLMRTRQIEGIRAVGEEITRELDLATLLQLITERSTELMGAVSGVVALWDEATRLLVPRAWFGLGERLKDLRWKPGEEIPGIPEVPTLTAALTEPLLFRDRLVGVIRIDRDANQQPFTEVDRQFLALFANTAAIAIENARLYSGAVRRSEETASLLRVSRSLMAGLELQETLKRIADEAARITRSAHAIVLLRDREKQTLRLGAVAGRPPALLDNYARGSKESLSAIVASTGQALFIADCAHDPRNPYADEDRALGIVTYLGLPIMTQGEVVGVLTVNTTQPREYTPEEIEYLSSFADYSAIAIENARLFEEVRAGRERLRALSRRQLEVHESERRLMARELHDEIGQLLTGLKLTLDMVVGEASDVGQSLLQESQDLIGELIGHVRELSLNLRPALLDDLGLLPALLWQFERYTARTRVRVDFSHAGLEGRPCQPEVETAAYRMVQEALTNVARHAQTSEVQVRLWVEEGRLLLRIEDQGRGFEPTITLDAEESRGLAGMQERAILLGGRLRIESSPGAGTRIQAELPLGEPERSN